MQARDRQFSQARAGHGGFTMTELMIVLVVMGILAALAAPSFSDMIKSQRIKSMASDLNASLTLARSEAVKRNKLVTMAPVTAGAWQGGWRIADPDNAGSYIEVHEAVASLTSTGPDSVVYRTSGRIQGNVAPEFNISAAGTSTVRCVTVDLSGRPYIKGSAC